MEKLFDQLHSRARAEEIHTRRAIYSPLNEKPIDVEPELDEFDVFIPSWRRSVACQVFRAKESWPLLICLSMKTRLPDESFVRWFEVSFFEELMFRDSVWIETEQIDILDAWISWLARKVVKPVDVPRIASNT